jgi:cob(I)alamin adenosyltransferase
MATNKVYTKKGDEGFTSLLSGARVHKRDNRIEMVGVLDELNSFIGLLRSEIIASPELKLEDIQWNLFNAGAMVINDNGNKDITNIDEIDIEVLELLMDEMSKELPELKNFIIPKGSRAVALAHVCRTIARRAERELANGIAGEILIEPIIPKYLNRLSDYFFVLARYLGMKQDINETIWKN